MTTLLYGAHVRANGIRQHYLRFGGTAGNNVDRDAVVIIPGITSPAVTWAFVGERLGQHFDTYILDVRGRGLSESSGTLDYGLDAQAADAIAFAKALGIKRYSLIGHSMGARIGLRMARQAPTELARLVMIDPPVSGPGRRAYPSQLPWYLDSMKLAREGADADAMRSFCPTWTREQLQLRAEWLHTCDERAIAASFEGFHTDDVHADMPHVQVPSLLMVAGRGDVIRAEDISEMQQLMPQLEVTHVAGAGHMIPWDDEAGFYSAFGEFLGAPLRA
ncbi:MAG: alpha/beta hydrolase [Pseudomonadota bacterium]